MKNKKELNEQEIILFYKDHTNKQTLEKFHIGKEKLFDVLLANNVKKHSRSDSGLLETSQKAETFLLDSANAFIDFHRNNSKKVCMEHFKLSNKVYECVRDRLQIEEHPAEEAYKMTIRAHFGIDNVFQLESTKKKSAETKLFKYGDPKYTNIEKQKLTNLSRYGNSCSLHGSNQEKTEKVITEKYGKKSFLLTEIGKEKALNTKQSSYLKEHSDEYTSEYLELRFNKERTQEFLKANILTLDELANRFNCSKGSIWRWICNTDSAHLFKHSLENGTSEKEKQLVAFIKEIYSGLIIENDKSLLKTKELDILIPDLKLAIEFNGTYWHSELRKTKMYHREKSDLVEARGYRLIHIYEYEWDTQKEIIEGVLQNVISKTNTRLEARKCEVVELDSLEYKNFIKTNHLLGPRPAKIKLGLKYNGILVQVMSFSKHKKYEWEIIRECSLLGYTVIGGSSKLFKYFLNKYMPKSVFSYCDYNKFSGKSYELLGMQYLGKTTPDFRWVLSNGIVVGRSPNKHQYYKENAIAKIYGCGSKKYLYTC